MRKEYNFIINNIEPIISKKCIDNMYDFLINEVPNSLFESVVSPTFHTPSVVGEFLGIGDFGVSYYYAVLKTASDIHTTTSIPYENGLYVILFGYSDKVSIFVSTRYDSSCEPWEQQDIIINTFVSHYVKVRNLTWYAHYIPAPTFSLSLDRPFMLVANYNDGVVMFSCIENKIQDGQLSYAVEKTSNIIIGNKITKFGEYEGGFFYGGDHIYTLELIYNFNVLGNTYYSQLMYVPDSKFSNISWHIKTWSPYRYPIPTTDVILSNPYGDHENSLFATNMPNTHNLCRFHLFLFAFIDNSPNRGMINIPSNSISLGNNSIYQYYKRAVWATTLDLDVYVPMQISISDQTSGLPTYKPLFSSNITDAGHTANTLNNISLIMELYFMCRRDPWVVGDYSCVGKSDIINYVNMLYMSTNSMEEGDFPLNQGKYNCFMIGVRRNKFGSKGFNGLAFKQEGE